MNIYPNDWNEENILNTEKILNSNACERYVKEIIVTRKVTKRNRFRAMIIKICFFNQRE